MELRHLRYALAVAEHGAFGRAARALHIAAPPLSRQIRALEQEIGTALFERAPGGVTPTAAGEVFVEHARQIVDAVAVGVARTRRAARERGALRMGSIASGLVSPVPEALARFRAEHPGWQLHCQEMSSRHATRAVIDGEIDVGLLRGPPRGAGAEGLTARSVRRDHLVLLCPEGHPFVAQGRVGWHQLRGEALVVTASDDEPAVVGVLDELVDAGGSPPITWATDIHTKIGLVAGGLGIGPLPSGARSLARSGTRVVDVGPVRRLPDVHLCWRSEDASPVLAAFLASVDAYLPRS